ncbi:hypothetical protein B0H67DRAFT_568058 [Lasiosphaeris hirsuta]|uniref:C3H1-type domain-containing protein n=1 Tax=Lasiosphaeris hirsuta TaxID=260670 RepID=A0AA40AYQ9_9PEZI|nr:hypothetical protein B0H67DRAFT_568058 [Lasiosphaeris hirsuta]
MAICRFFVQGYCRNGNACRFEHPGKQTQSQPANNRFSTLSGLSGQAMGNRQGELPYNLNPETIRHDLSEDVPTWILSAYGPGKLAPEQLFGGYPREQSFEEVRMHYLQGAAAGNEQGALSEIESLYQNAKQQINHTLNNMDSAIQFIVEAGNKHPNRNDICHQSTPTGGTSGEFSRDKLAPGGTFGSSANAFQATPVMPTISSNPFGAPAATPSPFGQPAALGQKPSPFRAPAFGQPATTPIFGQPAAMGGTSAFGQPSQPSGAFGQPSTIGAKPNPFGAPAFGQPAQPAAGPAFGQPSQPATTAAFGQPSQPTTTTAFGQPSQPTSAFGQPAALGQKPNPFGAPTTTTTTTTTTTPSPFGAPAAPAQPAANPFGQPAQPAQASSGFGQPAASPFGQPATTGGFSQPTPAPTNPFGQAQPQTSAAPTPFGQPATAFGAAPVKPAANPFGQPAAAPANPFGQAVAPQPAAPAPAPANPFGQAAQPTQPAANPFGQPAQPAAAPFGNVAAPRPSGRPSPYAPNATRQHADVTSYAGKGPDGRLRMFKGKPVSYTALGSGKDSKELPVVRSFDGTATRIWFPDGAPNYSPETEAEDKAYADPEVLRKWKVFMDTGRFEGGIMPEVPPKREFCAWDF